MINIYNAQRKVKINREFKDRLSRLLEQVLEEEDPDRSIQELNIIFVNNRRIRDINREFLGSDRPTDVISFNLGDVGEVYISAHVASKKAHEYGWSTEFELVRYAIHGTLHILGYDHEREEDAEVMEAKEEKYLEKW